MGLFGFSYSIVAQNTAIDSIPQMLSLADSLRRSKAYDESRAVYDQILNKTSAEEDWDSWFTGVQGKLRIAGKTYNYEELLTECEKARSILPSSEIRKHGKLLNYSGATYKRMGRYLESSEFDKQALPLLKEVNDTMGVLSSYTNLSGNYSRLGDDLSAIKFINEGIAYLGDRKEHRFYNSLWDNKGIYNYYRGAYEKSIAALDVGQTNGSSNAQAASYLVKSHIALNRLSEAKVVLDRLKQSDTDGEMYLSAHFEYLNALGNKEEARKLQQELVKRSKDYSEQRMHIKEISKLALHELEMGLSEASFANAHWAMSKHFELDSTDIYLYPELDSMKPETWMLEAGFIKAQYFEDQYQQSADPKDSIAASFYYDMIFKMNDNLKESYITDDSQYKLGAYTQTMYNRALNFYTGKYAEGENSDTYNLALKISQLSNSYVLRNAVTERKMMEEAGVDAGIINRYVSLKNELAQAEDLQNDRFVDSLVLPFDLLTKEIQESNPSFRIFQESSTISVEEIRAKLNAKTLLIKYHQIESFFFVFVITQSSIDFVKLPFSENLKKDILDFKELIKSSNEDLSSDQEVEFARSSFSVYKSLLEPILSDARYRDKNELIIVPDGPLKNLPFNAMIVNETDSWSDPSNYLLSKYKIAYLYYLSQLKLSESEEFRENDFFGFGIQNYDDELKKLIDEYLSNTGSGSGNSAIRSSDLEPLLNAVTEVMNSAKIFEGKFLTNEEVTIQAVKQNIANSRVAHFALHALIDPEDFKNSFVVLNENEENEFRLDYQQIIKLNSSNDLVVLSACQSGIGQEVLGEGAMSLARAFTYGGSKSTLSSYWNVPDMASMIFMDFFYSNLKSGMDKSEALRQAQIQYLTDDDKTSPSVRSPFYWAGWALYGDMEALESSSPEWSRYAWILIPVLLILALLFYRRKKKSQVLS